MLKTSISLYLGLDLLPSAEKKTCIILSYAPAGYHDGSWSLLNVDKTITELLAVKTTWFPLS